MTTKKIEDEEGAQCFTHKPLKYLKKKLMMHLLFLCMFNKYLSFINLNPIGFYHLLVFNKKKSFLS